MQNWRPELRLERGDLVIYENTVYSVEIDHTTSLAFLPCNAIVFYKTTDHVSNQSTSVPGSIYSPKQRQRSSRSVPVNIRPRSSFNNSRNRPVNQHSRTQSVHAVVDSLHSPEITAAEEVPQSLLENSDFDTTATQQENRDNSIWRYGGYAVGAAALGYFATRAYRHFRNGETE
ncbi:hypothetical protein HDV06_000476 [Boothiomyces sp. JEL0866]|nr:hypothetical protein HDV06_000476 [Boothiomyces sp. JEL0866]